MKMQYINTYDSPLGKILLACDDAGLTGLWFSGDKYYASNLTKTHIEKDTPVLRNTKSWLDIYFAGKEPDFFPSIHMIGSLFQLTVWEILQKIPYGHTTTYGQIAKQIASNRNSGHMSAQAVGGAVGRNAISIIIPCHRVVGTNGSLTGYGGGLPRKIKLLAYEGINMKHFFVPSKGTAL